MKSIFLRVFPILLIVSMLASCSVPAAPTQSVISMPTVILAPSATSPAPMSDDVWDRIMADQKIVVGTSWDYPPFSSVDPNFKVVGFDIAMIEEIGRRLQIPVEIQNYAFEGLPGALQINQIDLAVAAMAITPERTALMSFSPIYYVNQVAVLARDDGPVTGISDFNQLASLRVGVRRGTVHEQMVQSLLIDTGLMSPDKLFRYMQTDESISDLLQDRVDVVLLGEATASYYSAQHGLRVVGNGFHKQDLAIAMRLGTPRLKAEIDRVMDEMLTDGTILRLIQDYLQNDVAGLLSTPIAPASLIFPVPTVAPPPVCVDGMKFIADITYGDNNMKNPPFVNPGEKFIKTWRIKNTGTCTWTPNYRLIYAYGNVTAAQMGGSSIGIPGNVTSGQTVDLSVTLTAPIDPATYQGFWQFQNDKGMLFGQAIWVAVTNSPVAVANTPVATVQSGGDFCIVTITAPNRAVTALDSFDAVWTVKNVSGKDWGEDSVDYIFVSGAKMREQNGYDFSQTIKNGESGQITVDMIAPGDPGIYNTTWAIVSGSTTLCTLAQNVTVAPK